MKINSIVKNLPGLLIPICFYIFTSCHSINQQNPEVKNETMSKPVVKRVGMVIRIDSSRIREYLALHADSNFGVRDLLIKYNMRNFSIFMTRFDDGNYYEFGYYEYTGNNYDADMAALADEPRNKAWLKICDPMQVPFKGEASWKKMQQVFLNK
jgi:L-rhamnose mutarotase